MEFRTCHRMLASARMSAKSLATHKKSTASEEPGPGHAAASRCTRATSKNAEKRFALSTGIGYGNINKGCTRESARGDQDHATRSSI